MKKFFTLIALVVLCTVNAMAYDTWSVVGSKAIMNGTSDWTVDETANDMTTTDGESYTLTVTDKTLEKGTTYYYKFAYNHSWVDDKTVPNSADNYSLTVDETAVYTIVYTVNVSTKEGSAVATKTGAAGEITHAYSIAGNNTTLFGASWNAGNTTTDMTKGDDGVYSWTANNVALAAGSIEFKVVVDHSWGECYPSSNYILTVSEDGTYNVTITFNPDTKAVNATIENIGEAEITHTYSIAGSNTTLFGASWSETSTATDMTKGDDGVYSWTANNVALAAGSIEFKVVQDHSWSVCYPSSNYVLTVSEDGTYNVTITFNPDTKDVNATTTLVSTSINNLKTANQAATIFNLAGQRVNANAKGILIQNGKKFINK